MVDARFLRDMTVSLKRSEIIAMAQHLCIQPLNPNDTRQQQASSMFTHTTLTHNLECFATVVKHFVTMTPRSTHFLFLPVAAATVGEGSA